ncbi:hypothetical protein SAMN05421866_0087 [Chryseobacterium oranimense]|uniref:Uncharacterized protein n=2 Tax=Chryseobacterium oranimense TaxID=421058 RepID=A0A1M5XAK3_9FLAO|nr:hypothetical protein SAMN05421866_0087 [Chryseobacterium oranimense]
MSLDVSLYENNDCVYDSNITHNLTKMAHESGLYYALWRPEEINAFTAADLILILKNGIENLKSDPEKFRQYNASNGWGKYENLLSFTEQYLVACRNNPNAKIEISR